tara:strand:+ start:6148 stop:6738 length:591 start_codon:yes stop_codon:yes gene_type:complete
MKILKSSRQFTARAVLLAGLLLAGITTPAQAASSYSNVRVPALTTGLHLTNHVGGDGDLYSCWGKTIYYTVGLHTFLSVDKKRLMIDVFYRSYENGGDRSQFTSVKTYTLYTAPHGYVIENFPAIDIHRTQGKFGYHAGMPINLYWFSLDDLNVVVYGDQHGTDLMQGYTVEFGPSWNMQLKRTGTYVPNWNRRWR